MEKTLSDKTVNNQKKWILLIFFIYVVALGYFALRNEVIFWTSMSYYEFIKKTPNLIPFKTVIGYIVALFTHSMNLDISIKNLILPIISFIPFGILGYGYVDNKKKINCILGLGAGFSLIIEILQMVLRRGIFDIDDIILNSVGVIIGMWLLSLFKKQKAE